MSEQRQDAAPRGGGRRKKKRARHGGAVPSPKKAKQLRERAAVAAALGKPAEGAAGAAAGPLLGGPQHALAEAAEQAAGTLREHWRVLVAVAVVLALLAGFFAWRAQRAASRLRQAWQELEQTARTPEAASDPARWLALYERYRDTAAAPYLRLRAEDARLLRAGPGELEAARAGYEALARQFPEQSVPGYLARHGAEIARAHQEFDPATAEGGPALEAVAGLRPLPGGMPAAPAAVSPSAETTPAAPAPAQ